MTRRPKTPAPTAAHASRKGKGKSQSRPAAANTPRKSASQPHVAEKSAKSVAASKAPVKAVAKPAGKAVPPAAASAAHAAAKPAGKQAAEAAGHAAGHATGHAQGHAQGKKGAAPVATPEPKGKRAAAVAPVATERRVVKPEDRQSQLKLLIARGKEQGYLTYAQVNDHLPSEIVDPEQIEDIVNTINDMGIPVYE